MEIQTFREEFNPAANSPMSQALHTIGYVQAKIEAGTADHADRYHLNAAQQRLGQYAEACRRIKRNLARLPETPAGPGRPAMTGEHISQGSEAERQRLEKQLYAYLGDPAQPFQEKVVHLAGWQ
jgi:hypothetical protein